MNRRQRSTNNGSLQAQVNRLTQMVGQLTTTSTQRSRSRRRSRSRQNQNIVTAPAATSRSMSRGRRQATRAGPNTLNPNTTGTIRLTNRELFTSLTIDPSTYTGDSWGGAILVNASDSVGFLAKLGKLFGRVRWLSLDFEFESAVSTSTDGVLAYGLDWTCTPIAAAAGATTLANATALNPSVSHPIWSSGIRLPRAPRGRLNARTWYDTTSSVSDISSVAALYYYLSTPKPASKKIFGALWISYSVELQGPHL